MKRYALDALIMLVALGLGLVLREAWYGYQRANAAFAWANEANCRVFPERCQNKPTPEAQERK